MKYFGKLLISFTKHNTNTIKYVTQIERFPHIDIALKISRPGTLSYCGFLACYVHTCHARLLKLLFNVHLAKISYNIPKFMRVSRVYAKQNGHINNDTVEFIIVLVVSFFLPLPFGRRNLIY